MDDDDVVVDVDVGGPVPLLEASVAADHEAGESGVGEKEGGFEVGFNGGDVNWVFEAHGAVDYLVHLGLEEEPTNWGYGLFGELVSCRRTHTER